MSSDKGGKKGGILYTAIVLALFFGTLLALAYLIGFDTIADREKLTAYIAGFGALAPLIFFGVQLLQIIVAPIPGNVTGLVGGALFGIWGGFALNAASTAIGSLIMFFLGKKFGLSAMHRFVEQKHIDKFYPKLSGKNARLVLMGLFLIPFVPDDAICLLAGLTDMSYFLFMLYVAVGRFPSCFITNAMGGLYSGDTVKIALYSLCYYGAVLLIYFSYDKLKGKFTKKAGD